MIPNENQIPLNFEEEEEEGEEMQDCPLCSGSGEDDDGEECSECEGSGEIPVDS